MYPIKFIHHKRNTIFGVQVVAMFATLKKCHLCDTVHNQGSCSVYCEQCWKEGCGKQEHPTRKHDEWVEEQKKKMCVFKPTYDIEVIVHYTPSKLSKSHTEGTKPKYTPPGSGYVHSHYHFHMEKSKDDSPSWHHPMAKAYGIPARRHR